MGLSREKVTDIAFQISGVSCPKSSAKSLVKQPCPLMTTISPVGRSAELWNARTGTLWPRPADRSMMKTASVDASYS